MVSTKEGSEYLPKNYWYPGMNKGKAGKGYRNDIPLGILGGPCEGSWINPKCTGTIISLKMNISSRGFETTSEKVCETCGALYPSPYQLGGGVTPDKPPKRKKYHTKTTEIDDALTKYYNTDGKEIYAKKVELDKESGRTKKHFLTKNVRLGEIKTTEYEIEYDHYWETHESWFNDNTNEPTHEPDSSSESYKEGEEPEVLKDMFYWTEEQVRIGKKLKLANPKHTIYYNRSKEEKAEYDLALRMRMVEAIASGMELNKLQVDQVKYVIKKHPGLMKIDSSIEDIITCVCVSTMSMNYDDEHVDDLLSEMIEDYNINIQLFNIVDPIVYECSR
jgi:hypothetical protein